MKSKMYIGLLACSGVEVFLISQSVRTGKPYFVPILIMAVISVIILLIGKSR